MASGNQGEGVNSRVTDREKRFEVLYRELVLELQPDYLWGCFVRSWLQLDEKRVSERGATAERPEERLLNNYVLLQAYILMAVKGLGYLALTWSTVVLLGGFVTSLQRNDFWCLTVISMIQAARIFDNVQGNLLPSLLKLFIRLVGIDNTSYHSNETTTDSSDRRFSSFFLYMKFYRKTFFRFIGIILTFPIRATVGFVLYLYRLGPFVCMALSWWRLWVRDFGDTGEDHSKANLKPALIIFYALVLLQGAFFLLWQLCDTLDDEIVRSVYRRCKLCREWGRNVVAGYLLDTRVKCEREPTSATDNNLVRYAVDLLDSEVPDKYISGARTLDTLIKQGEDVRSLLLLSRPKIQKLIDTVGWRSYAANNCEIRELAARILADLADDMYLDQFPGAIQCISSLFQTNEPYCKGLRQFPHQKSSLLAVSGEGRGTAVLGKIRIEMAYRDDKKIYVQNKEGGGTCNSKELILQGFTILERLASNQHNCREIRQSPGLIDKIMAPIKSNDLIEHIKIGAWADLVSRSLKVLHKLIRCPEEIGTRLRRNVYSYKKAMSNLESITDQGNEADEELQMRAVEILTELAMDASVKINRGTEKNLIRSQMKIFLACDGEEKPGSMLRTTAGRTLAVLTKKSEVNCVFITGEFNNIIDHLTIMLDATTNIIYRPIAAEILENLCTYCHETMQKQNVAETLLSKILPEILCNGHRNISELVDNEGINTPAAADDEENRLPEHVSKRKSSNHGNYHLALFKILGKVSTCFCSLLSGQRQSFNQGNNTIDQITQKGLQETLLSLTLVIYGRLIGADGFAAAVQQIAPGHGAFVAKLKAIVEDNYQATPNSLRIIKLCSQIAISMMKCSQYTEHFKDLKFVESLSKAIEIMTDLEIYMLFSGTDFGVKDTARPLLSDLEKELKRMLQ